MLIHSCQNLLESESIFVTFYVKPNLILKYGENFEKSISIFLSKFGTLAPQNVVSWETKGRPDLNLLISPFKPLRQQQSIFYPGRLRSHDNIISV